MKTFWLVSCLLCSNIAALAESSSAEKELVPGITRVAKPPAEMKLDALRAAC